MSEITIALDMMGGDHGLKVTAPSVLQTLAHHPSIKLILVGDKSVITAAIGQSAALTYKSRLVIHHASEQVAMDESPSHALRRKKDSSMRVAINLVREHQAQACVSAGNTGALTAIARFVLRTLPSIDKPALMTAFPTIKPQKLTRMLDLGASIDAQAEHLYQFAVMGAVVAEMEGGITRPKVGLLNVGVENIKGNSCVKRADQLLSDKASINYVGFVEGNALFTGEIDIMVCDGFVGNSVLKACEGEAKMIKHYLKDLVEKSWIKKGLAYLARPVLLPLITQFNTSRHNGACLLGLNGIVIKSHGGADQEAFSHAISEAILQVKNNVPELISHKIAHLLGDG